jgi:hypothetical protein
MEYPDTQFNESTITLIIDNDMVDPLVAFDKAFKSLCNCRKHWWQFWKDEKCVVVAATVGGGNDEGYFDLDSLAPIMEEE